MNRWKDVVAKLLLVLFALLLANFLVMLFRPDLSIPDDWHLPHQVSETNLVHELKANYSGYWQGVPIETNGINLRDKDYPLSKDEGVVRIIMIGDSVIFGAKVSEEDTVSSVLERKLNKYAGLKKY